MQNPDQIILSCGSKKARNVIAISVFLHVLSLIPFIVLRLFDNVGYIVYLAGLAVALLVFDIIYVRMKAKKKVILEEDALLLLDGKKNNTTHTYDEISEATLIKEGGLKAKLDFHNGQSWSFEIDKDALLFLQRHGISFEVEQP